MSTTQEVNIQPRPNVKQINYVAKTFTDFRQNLIEFTKSYYPNTYSDFNEASPGMMFIEMAAYLGDVLSFYIDNSFKENLLAYAEQQENIISLAQFLGYKPKLTSPASTVATLFQVVNSVLVNGEYVPNPKYLLKISAGSKFRSTGTNSVQFTLTENVDFSNALGRSVFVNQLDISNNPTSFLVSKEVKLLAAEETTQTFQFASAQRFSSVELTDGNVIGIIDVVDSNGNNWYEVDYLAQDVIMDDVEITTTNTETGELPSSTLRLKSVPRRFVTRVNKNLKTELMFGSGTGNEAETDLLVDSRQIANSQYGNFITSALANTAINNINYLTSNAYGIAPANISLTVRYWKGGGVNSNVSSQTITIVDSITTTNDTTAYSSAELQEFNNAVASVAVKNDFPATGGGSAESLDEIKENALAFFNAQNRTVTVEDYVNRTYAIPAKYGRIAKAHAIRDEQINRIQVLNDTNFVSNPVRPNSINLYTLGYDNNGKLSTLNSITKQNLARYLEQYRMLTDDVNILDAFIINIGVRFDVAVFRNYNINDVLIRCIGAVQDFFDIKRWSIGKPIVISDLQYKLGTVDGVQTVNTIEIFNKYLYKDGTGYQNYKYNIQQATIDGIIYPSLDPSIFELKFPQTDIIGNATQ